jgi:repressor LexA
MQTDGREARMADDLSVRQMDIMRFIEEYIRKNRRPPTNREIGQEFGILSTGHVDHHLTVLEQRGYIAREAKKSRSIRVLRPLLRPGLPIRGTIAAGQPLGIYEDADQETLDFSLYVSDPPRDEYVLLVRGDSMIEDHITDGDYVVIKQTDEAHDGDIIVATHMTGSGELGAATLKRFYREKDRIRLQPANSTMEPIYIKAREWDREWKVQGRVLSVYRSWSS